MSATRASLERLARYGIRPNRKLGQNFLVDDNILGVIGRAADLRRDDVVLEVGGGLGVLSDYLAARVGHLHVVETDRQLEPLLREALASHAHVTLVVDDVMNVDLTALRPEPNKVVSNLPYGVAVPALLKTIDELSRVSFWCVMVQREIADRLVATPTTKAYAAPTVLVQLACEVRLERPISRSVFQPAPNVDSALITLRRHAPAPAADVRRLVRGAFAHRRKALARSLELASGGTAQLRAAARAALEQLGHPPDERAERLAPQEFVALAQKLESWTR